MLRHAVRNLLSHKLRLSLSGIAVVLGVAFIAGTLTFTDALNRTFTNLYEQTSADVNVAPRSVVETGLVGTGLSSSVATVPRAVVDEIAGIDGVEVAAGTVSSEGVYVLDRQGEIVGTGGAPGVGAGWTGEPDLDASAIVEGRAPERAGEVALEVDTAEKADYGVGDRVVVLTPGPRVEAEVTGLVRFGEDGGTAGATLVVFDTATAQDLLLEPGEFSAVSVAAEDGVEDSVLAARVAAAVGDGYDVKTRTEQASDGAAEMEEELAFINTFLLVFAGVALFVGSFLILNTFSMLIAQRTRELALMRALGASRRQLTASVLLEALLLGLAGSTSGLLVGYGLAHGLKALFGKIGLTIDGSLVLTPETIGWSYLVGVLVTLVAAYLPARRAASVPPVAAMRADLASGVRPLRVRTIAGLVLAGLGLAGLAAGVIPDDGSGALLGAGALCLLLAAIALSPVLAVPFIRLVGALLPRLAGRTGHLARENALRNPRRTAATSSALMVGLALVTGFSILGASARASVDAKIDEVLEADYVVSTGTARPFTPQVAEELARVDGVASVTQERFGIALVDGSKSFFTAYDPAVMGTALRTEFSEGDLSNLDRDGILITASVAEDDDLGLGDRVDFVFPNGQERSLQVGGVLSNTDVIGPYVLSMETYRETRGAELDRAVYVKLAGDADADAVQAAMADVVAGYPVVDLKDAEEFKEQERGEVDQMLMLINALLVLSVLIAVLGVVNTLVLSVIERTRELGLLRALGMSRRQVRRLVRLESVVISVYGATLGLVLGVVLGLALTETLQGEGLTERAVPGAQLVTFLLLGGLIGVVAAALPARRAGRLDLLQAIATE